MYNPNITFLLNVDLLDFCCIYGSDYFNLNRTYSYRKSKPYFSRVSLSFLCLLHTPHTTNPESKSRNCGGCWSWRWWSWLYSVVLSLGMMIFDNVMVLLLLIRTDEWRWCCCCWCCSLWWWRWTVDKISPDSRRRRGTLNLPLGRPPSQKMFVN